MYAILQRELLVSARSYRLGWLRAAVGTAAVVTLALSSVGEGAALRGSGFSLFNTFFELGAVGLLLLTPAVTCDLISRERREGTLGLLMITPLSVKAVVLSKAAAGVLRTLVVWLAMVPVLVVPVLMGGVLLMLVVAYRSVGIGRGEAESGMLEMLQVTPLGRDLPGTALRVLGRELGPFVLLHAVGCLILVGFVGEAKGLVSVLVLVAGGPAAAWVGQWGTTHVRSLLLSRVAVLLGVFLVPWWVARIGFPALFPRGVWEWDPAWLTGLGCVVALAWQGLLALLAARRVRTELVHQRWWGSPGMSGNPG